MHGIQMEKEHDMQEGDRGESAVEKEGWGNGTAGKMKRRKEVRVA